MEKQTTNIANINTVIDTYISAHISGWTDYCEYHCQKQRLIYPSQTNSDDIRDNILNLSIDHALQLGEKCILDLLREESLTVGYSQMDMWMLRHIKHEVFATSLAKLQKEDI